MPEPGGPHSQVSPPSSPAATRRACCERLDVARRQEAGKYGAVRQAHAQWYLTHVSLQARAGNCHARRVKALT